MVERRGHWKGKNRVNLFDHSHGTPGRESRGKRKVILDRQGGHQGGQRGKELTMAEPQQGAVRDFSDGMGATVQGTKGSAC